MNVGTIKERLCRFHRPSHTDLRVFSENKIYSSTVNAKKKETIKTIERRKKNIRSQLFKTEIIKNKSVRSNN